MLRRLLDRVFFRHAAMIYEITPRCNLRCSQCYNIWKNSPESSSVASANERQDGVELPPREALALAARIISLSRCRNFTITGGEPCLRPDLEDIVRFAARRVRQVTVITNGTLLDDARIASLIDAGVSLFELPLNAGRARMHNRLAWGDFSPCPLGADFIPPFNAFDRVTAAAAEISRLGAQLAFVFVATRHNIHEWEEALKIGIALGARGFLFNRYNAGGACHSAPQDMLPSVEDLQAGLAIAERYARDYHIGIGASIAMPPCLTPHEAYPHVGFGYCAAGTNRAYYTISPMGLVRPCNHSNTVLGDLRRESLRRIVRGEALRRFMRTCPEFCRDCRLEAECQGGCKAAAEACYSDLNTPEPFLQTNLEAARKGKAAL